MKGENHGLWPFFPSNWPGANLSQSNDMSALQLHRTERAEWNGDRRSAPRRPIRGLRDRVKLRSFGEVTILNASPYGILIEGSARLQPGGRIELQLQSPSIYVPAVIARCEVSILNENGVTYRAGLSFAQPLAVDWSAERDAVLS
jgi:hypothetical protein